MTNTSNADIDVTLHAEQGGPIVIQAICQGAKMTLEFDGNSAGGLEVLTQNAEEIASEAIDAALAKVDSQGGE